jgi:hypothetical protein
MFKGFDHCSVKLDLFEFTSESDLHVLFGFLVLFSKYSTSRIVPDRSRKLSLCQFQIIALPFTSNLESNRRCFMEEYTSRAIFGASTNRFFEGVTVVYLGLHCVWNFFWSSWAQFSHSDLYGRVPRWHFNFLAYLICDCQEEQHPLELTSANYCLPVLWNWKDTLDRTKYEPNWIPNEGEH